MLLIDSQIRDIDFSSTGRTNLDRARNLWRAPDRGPDLLTAPGYRYRRLDHEVVRL